MRVCAITQRVDRVPGRGEVRDSLDQRLAVWVLRQGFLPLPVPNRMSTRSAFRAWLSRIKPDCLLLSGGNDWGEFSERDRTEFWLLEWALTRKMRVLGICRGMQVMARFSGGRLARVDGHCGVPHRLLGGTAVVNSFHRWAVRGCPPGFRIVQTAPDGCPERMQHGKLPWTGVMWHPERPGNRGVRIRL
jgi:putative glutamine amidotransferase